MVMHGSKRWDVKWVAERALIAFLLLVSLYVTSSLQNSDQKPSNETKGVGVDTNHPQGFYRHTWPGMKFGWKIIVGSIIGFLGSAFGTVGGVGGGGIFVPMLTLIIGFDARSATAISKCMITGGAGATVFYNLKQRHPTLDMPQCELLFSLAFQSMHSSRALKHGKKKPLSKRQLDRIHSQMVSVIENVRWKELGILFSVWILVLALQIGKNYTKTCSAIYWVLNLLQVPITVGTTSYEAMLLYKGRRVIASKGDQQTNWRVLQLILYCTCGILGGIIGGLLGLGGGFILGPLFIGLGIPPQVSSATSTFAMTFSASMSVVEYYLLKRFPIPYALYLVAVATAAALVGQHLVRKVIAVLGRTSLIIFILALTVFVSGISLGGVGIAKLIEKKANTNFENLCTYRIMTFGWKIIVGTIVGFLGSAFGTVGGVGGGGIFVPMLTLIIGFDAKSATAISKCMITGGAGATVFYNLRQRHPTLDLPVIDYDLALFFQPMLMLGISIGVAFNVIFPDWMLTTLLIVFFVGISVKSFFKGVDTWKKETIIKKEAKKKTQLNDIGMTEDSAHYIQTGNLINDSHTNPNQSQKKVVSVVENIHWKELGLLFFVWFMILALEIGKKYTTTCSVVYWALNLLQVPIAVGMSSYEGVRLYKGRRIIVSKGDQQTHWGVLQLILLGACGILAGTIAGLLGLGGGFILGPLFLGLGIHPQVASATSTLTMAFSASMAVVEYYLLKRFPIPYTLYFVAVSTGAALVGQHLVRKVIAMLGRASVIIFILTLTLSVSAVLLGGVGIAKMIRRIENKEYMGFGDLCTYRVRQ
ncbi:hypothetical protein RJT34_03597 [Clitoria ternatea]|uniref:Sulfite exporter TauE/SafE family protein n=1 Tax=Clitoria ternatea TaxID=43366 RepID=A0AAN9PZY0_CLITE